MFRWSQRDGALAAFAVGSVAWSVAAHADDAKKRAYGQHLARECTSCHRIDGVDNGIPSITGWAASDFVTTMGFYRTGARPNQAMVSVAQSLSDDEVKALAAYYGSLPKAPRRSR